MLEKLPERLTGGECCVVLERATLPKICIPSFFARLPMQQLKLFSEQIFITIAAKSVYEALCQSFPFLQLPVCRST